MRRVETMKPGLLSLKLFVEGAGQVEVEVEVEVPERKRERR